MSNTDLWMAGVAAFSALYVVIRVKIDQAQRRRAQRLQQARSFRRRRRRACQANAIQW